MESRQLDEELLTELKEFGKGLSEETIAKIKIANALGHDQFYIKKLLDEAKDFVTGLDQAPESKIKDSSIQFAEVEEELFEDYSLKLSIVYHSLQNYLKIFKSIENADSYVIHLIYHRLIELEHAYTQLTTVGADDLLNGKLLDQPVEATTNPAQPRLDVQFRSLFNLFSHKSSDPKIPGPYLEQESVNTLEGKKLSR